MRDDMPNLSTSIAVRVQRWGTGSTPRVAREPAAHMSGSNTLSARENDPQSFVEQTLGEDPGGVDAMPSTVVNPRATVVTGESFRAAAPGKAHVRRQVDSGRRSGEVEGTAEDVPATSEEDTREAVNGNDGDGDGWELGLRIAAAASGRESSAEKPPGPTAAPVRPLTPPIMARLRHGGCGDSDPGACGGVEAQGSDGGGVQGGGGGTRLRCPDGGGGAMARGGGDVAESSVTGGIVKRLDFHDLFV